MVSLPSWFRAVRVNSYSVPGTTGISSAVSPPGSEYSSIFCEYLTTSVSVSAPASVVRLVRTHVTRTVVRLTAVDVREVGKDGGTGEQQLCIRHFFIP